MYLGDGLPPCSELPKGSFLLTGARYEFLSSYSGSDVLKLQSSSPLYQALCGSGGACSFQPVVILQQDLTCSGDECTTTWPHVVELSDQGVYYEYSLPRCMHLFFFEGRIVTGGGERRWWTSRRVCTNPETPQGGSYCCGGCSSVAPSWFADNGMTCATANDNTFTREDRCMGNDWWAQNRYCEKRCFAAGNSYGINCSSDGDYREDHVCGYEEELVPFSEAEKNCKGIGMNICDRQSGELPHRQDEDEQSLGELGQWAA